MILQGKSRCLKIFLRPELAKVTPWYHDIFAVDADCMDSHHTSTLVLMRPCRSCKDRSIPWYSIRFCAVHLSDSG